MAKLNPTFKVVSVLVIISAIALLGFNFLKRKDIFNFAKTRYYAIFPDVGDLQVGAAVKLSGFVIGEVDEIEEVDKRLSALKVTIKLTRDVEIPVNSSAYIKEPFGGLGSSSIIIEKGDAPAILHNKDTIRTYELPDSLSHPGAKEITTGILEALSEFARKQDSLRRVDSLRLEK